ncbi:MAG TPA: 30S ribosomal protein S1 [Bryobacteraceae bacterium]|jgi:small subunit ribosomal protein S1|nr:30S ribosomal protein S1 [Bryobacteraceae bacterium]
MSNVNFDPAASTDDEIKPEDNGFAEILSSFERQHADVRAGETINGTIVSIGPEAILIDVGRKTEGSLSVTKWKEAQTEEPKIGATVMVSVGPRNEEGYYELSTMKVERPRDWSALQAAYENKHNIAGIVSEQVKGGFRVEIGVRAFMPASRSGVREANEMPNLVGQEIQCRISKLDTEKEDVVVDRRVVLEEEQAGRRQQRFDEIQEGAIIEGRVRSVTDFGAFVDLGGVDGLLRVGDISWSRIAKASDVIKPDDQLTVKVLKIDSQNQKISLGLKQLQDDPWTVAAQTFNTGDRVSGTVSRLTDFGAFIELLPGVDGLIHVSELSWNKRVRKPGDLLKIGERVEAVVLGVEPAAKRISLGYKQALGNPWDTVPQRLAPGTIVEGPVTNLTPFGAFIDLGDGIEGMVHISDITNEKRLDHPKDKLTKGQSVRAAVVEIDSSRKRIRLSMKQLEPTTVDHFISEHQAGETVSGRLVEVHGDLAKVELGEGVIATCQLRNNTESKPAAAEPKPADVSSLSAMLAQRWKQGASSSETREGARPGQVRTFRISGLDAGKRLIQLELAS